MNQVEGKVWLDSRTSGISTNASIKWCVRRIRSFAVKKILHPDVYMLNTNKCVGKSWHPVFHVSLLKKYVRDEKWLHLWQEDLRASPRLLGKHDTASGGYRECVALGGPWADKGPSLAQLSCHCNAVTSFFWSQWPTATFSPHLHIQTAVSL
jgi:hypothetical protein